MYDPEDAKLRKGGSETTSPRQQIYEWRPAKLRLTLVSAVVGEQLDLHGYLGTAEWRDIAIRPA